MAITDERLRVRGIGEFLHEKVLKVPPRQRSYAWEAEHVEDFWHDIHLSLEHDPNEDYFLGSIVLSTTAGKRLEVVDGQQRLATTTILIAAIRDYFLEHKDEHEFDKRAGVLERNYLMNEDEDTLEREPHLTMNTKDAQFFREHIVYPSEGKRRNPLDDKKVKLSPSNRNIALAAQILRAKINAYAASVRSTNKAEWLMRIVAYVRERVKVIAVTVSDHDNAYTIFETLNDRGLDLSKADLLKNHLLREAGERGDEVENHWSKMTGILESTFKKDRTVEYLRHLWLATRGHVRSKDLYKTIKRVITRPSEAVEFAVEISGSAQKFVALLSSDHHSWSAYGENLRHDLSTLILLDFERLHPITLAAVSKFPSHEFAKTVYYLVCASVRFLIAGAAPGESLDHRISTIAVSITEGRITNTKQLAAEMNSDIVPGDPTFARLFATASVSKVRLARYYLRAMENARLPDDPTPARVMGSQKDYDLEHILPENPGPAWSHIPREVAKACCNRIGNLCLMYKKSNSDIGNEDFSTVKVPAYLDSVYVLTQEVASAAKWDEQEIDRRQIELADLACRTWPITVK